MNVEIINSDVYSIEIAFFARIFWTNVFLDRDLAVSFLEANVSFAGN
jgi:hypothetical protein